MNLNNLRPMNPMQILLYTPKYNPGVLKLLLITLTEKVLWILEHINLFLYHNLRWEQQRNKPLGVHVIYANF